MSPADKKRMLDDEELFGADGIPHHGKQHNQKMKPYLVYQYLMRETDEDHVLSATAIAEYLKEECKVYAERRSVCEDINGINAALLMQEEECTMSEAIKMLEEDDELKVIVYDPHKKGYYVRQRHYDLNDIRLLAECVYSAKFVTERQAKRLVDVVCEFVSDHQAEIIQHNAFLTDRVKTSNKSVMNNIATINQAMSRRLEGQPHQPEQIAFKYLKHEINHLTDTVERRKGKDYIANPYALLINDGNYYLLVYDETVKKGPPIRTYRVDRMRDVRCTGTPREGDAFFRTFDLKTYARQSFGMYGGEKRRVTIRFIPTLLDTMIERFGTNNVQYSKAGERYFNVSAEVDVSDQFFGWLLGFGVRVHLVYPDDVVERFKAYIDRVRDRY